MSYIPRTKCRGLVLVNYCAYPVSMNEDVVFCLHKLLVSFPNLLAFDLNLRRND